MQEQHQRLLPVGAELASETGAHFRVWAPGCAQLDLVLEEPAATPRFFPMQDEENGYFSLFSPEARAGSFYRFRRKDQDFLLPDPASRFQPQGPHGPSQVIDTRAFKWTDETWKGLPLKGQVFYEMHIGTFTKDGTWASAQRQLSKLKKLGITCIEIMPIAEFDGEFGWGYDGVDLFAPYHNYGTPEDLHRFINEAHRLELCVVLDVVYNHLGPSGNYLGYFSENYFTDRYLNEWGKPFNFEGDEARPVRDFFISNALYWVKEFHFDGFRVDATQSIHDASPTHILQEITDGCRQACPDRSLLFIAENETQDVKTIEKVEDGGYGFDAVWNDDFHHALKVALTGRREAYFADYSGSVDELLSSIQYGYLYQGQYNHRQKKNRGTPVLDVPADRFVVFLQNHDQVANSSRGEGLHDLTSPAKLRAATMLLLLSPQTPLIFQGQEFGSPVPFCYFADHQPELAALVSKGRQEFLSQFQSFANSNRTLTFCEPDDPYTFERCKLSFEDLPDSHSTFHFFRDLLLLRKTDPVLRLQDARCMRASSLNAFAFALRFGSPEGKDRLFVINLGRDLEPADLPAQPLLVPPTHQKWKLMIASELPEYGGSGVPDCSDKEEWSFVSQASYLFKAVSAGEEHG